MQQYAAPMGIDRLLGDVAGRLLRVIEDENRLLTERQGQSLDASIQKKSQLLLELLRLQKSCNASALLPASQQLLKSLRDALDANRRLLEMHLAAAREVTDTILDALRQGESDGTYGASASAYYGTP